MTDRNSRKGDPAETLVDFHKPKENLPECRRRILLKERLQKLQKGDNDLTASTPKGSASPPAPQCDVRHSVEDVAVVPTVHRRESEEHKSSPDRSFGSCQSLETSPTLRLGPIDVAIKGSCTSEDDVLPHLEPLSDTASQQTDKPVSMSEYSPNTLHDLEGDTSVSDSALTGSASDHRDSQPMRSPPAQSEDAKLPSLSVPFARMLPSKTYSLSSPQIQSAATPQGLPHQSISQSSSGTTRAKRKPESHGSIFAPPPIFRRQDKSAQNCEGHQAQRSIPILKAAIQPTAMGSVAQQSSCAQAIEASSTQSIPSSRPKKATNTEDNTIRPPVLRDTILSASVVNTYPPHSDDIRIMGPSQATPMRLRGSEDPKSHNVEDNFQNEVPKSPDVSGLTKKLDQRPMISVSPQISPSPTNPN